jgi:hypothetical protein
MRQPRLPGWPFIPSHNIVHGLIRPKEEVPADGRRAQVAEASVAKGGMAFKVPSRSDHPLAIRPKEEARADRNEPGFSTRVLLWEHSEFRSAALS